MAADMTKTEANLVSLDKATNFVTSINDFLLTPVQKVLDDFIDKEKLNNIEYIEDITMSQENMKIELLTDIESLKAFVKKGNITDIVLVEKLIEKIKINNIKMAESFEG
jgi:hypothetical protein